MCPPSIVLWCIVLLLVVSSSESREHSTSGDEQSGNSTVRYEFLHDSMKCQDDEMKPIQCNSPENSIKNGDEMQYEFRINSTKNGDSVRYESRGQIKNRVESNRMSMESRANSTEIDDSMLGEINENLTKTEDESNSTSYEFRNTDKNNITTILYESCNDVTCIQLCCPLGYNLTLQGQCVAGTNNYSFPDVYNYENNSEDQTLDELFQLTVRDPCFLQGLGRSLLYYESYSILPNGSLYQGPGKLISASSYCLAIFNRNIYDVITCTTRAKAPIFVSVCLLVSLPFLLLTFVVYSILPELRNIHGYTLRAQIISLFITYVIMYIGQQISGLATKSYCIPMAYIFNFSFSSNFFWLNITCFDIWWTFRGLRSTRININQDKKKFVIYSIYAWGIAFILTVACAIIDNVSKIPENWIRPEMCKIKFWFSEDWAKTIYFYIPIGATLISNICFFIATTVTILNQKRHIAHQMRDTESRRHDENKQSFSMYLKLFIVMGISWIMEIISWSISTDLVSPIAWHFTDMINALQGLIIFIIFVCRKKIKRLLLKRFGGQNCGPFCKIPMSDSMASNTTTTSGTVSMQERSNPVIVPEGSINPAYSTTM